MRNKFRYSLLALSALAITACGDKEPVAETNVVVVEPEADDTQVVLTETDPQEVVVVNQTEQPIDYGSALDTQKGMAALEVGKDAVQMGLESFNKDEVKAIAGAVAAKAAKFGKDNNGTAANTGAPKDWKSLETTGVRVIDGDTVEVLVAGQQSERVRLLGIDAPESKQEFGQNSKQSLENCVAGGPVTVSYNETDRYGRLLGKVIAGGVDCNYDQIKTGSAWHYKQYQKGQPAGDATMYSASELQAKNAQVGLWANPNAQEPWSYRKLNK